MKAVVILHWCCASMEYNHDYWHLGAIAIFMLPLRSLILTNYSPSLVFIGSMTLLLVCNVLDGTEALVGFSTPIGDQATLMLYGPVAIDSAST